MKPTILNHVIEHYYDHGSISSFVSNVDQSGILVVSLIEWHDFTDATLPQIELKRLLNWSQEEQLDAVRQELFNRAEQLAGKRLGKFVAEPLI